MKRANISSAYEKILPFIPAQLLDELTRERLEKFKKYIPSDLLTDYFGFESTLLPDKKWIDVLFYFYLSEEFISSIENFIKTEKLADVWKDFLFFLKKCSEENLFSHENITSLWLEFDVSSSLVWPPKPSVFFTVRKSRQLEVIFSKLFGILNSQQNTSSFSPALTSFLNTCHEKKLEIFSIGIMLSRLSKGVRICISGTELMNTKVIEDLLNSIGYRKEIRSFLAFLEKVAPFVSELRLHLDFDETFGHKLGLECFCSRTSFQKIRENWERLLFFLVSEKFTTIEKQNALLSWLGGHKENSMLNEGSFYQFLRNINHVKMNYIPESGMEFKAYLSVFQEQKNLA